MVVLDVGLTVGAGAALPSIDDFFGSASVPGGAAHKRVDFSHKHAQPAEAAARTPPPQKGKERGKQGKDSEKEDRQARDGDSAERRKRPKTSVAADESAQADASDSDKGEDDKIERTVFVGGVPLAEEGRLINPKTIKAFFRDCGEVESVRLRSLPVENPMLPKKAAIAMGKINGKRETCNAYVVFKNKESIAAALRKDGSTFGDEDHRIRVDEAKPPGEGGQSHNVRLSVFVGNVPFNAEEAALRDHFSKCGEITKVRIVRDPKTLLGKGFAYVTFTDCDAVSNAMELNGSKFLKRDLRVTRCSKKPSPRHHIGTDNAMGKSGTKNAGSNRMGAEFRRRKQREAKRSDSQASGAAKKDGKLQKGSKPFVSKESKEAKLKKKDKYLKIKRTPTFKKPKKDKGANSGIKGAPKSKGEKRRGKEKKGLKKAKKAFKGKTRKM